jgi:LAS superfamily LD-carboxypeptidase LdcB
VAKNGAIAPTTVVFKDEAEVSAFQNGLQKASESLGGFTLELQAPAMKDLKEAIADAKTQGLSISPRGADSAKRTYTETVGLWKSRVDPALTHWTGKGKITQADADRIKKMSTVEQASEVLKLEENGIFFAKDLSKSIIYSVAPPGTSQHLSLLALDVKEFDDAKVRAILAQHGWFQTVASDLPHFTYLGVKESELEGLGLKKITDGGRTFWVPAI